MTDPMVVPVETPKIGACPICSGDCASANPPVMFCPMQEIDRLRRDNAKLVEAMQSAPRPSSDPTAAWLLSYIDWFFKIRGAALRVETPEIGACPIYGGPDQDGKRA